MDITWFGRACFRIVERGHTSIVTDPYKPKRGAPALKLQADLVTVSHDPGAHQLDQVKDRHYVISSPGEYEVGELFVTGIALHYHDAESDRVHDNIAYLFEYPNQLTILHLGNLHEVPSQSFLELLDEVHVLLLPVGGKGGLPGEQLAEVISLIEPNFVVPMHVDGGRAAAHAKALEGFFKALGMSQVEAIDSLRVSASVLPEQTQITPLTTTLPAL